MSYFQRGTLSILIVELCNLVLVTVLFVAKFKFPVLLFGTFVSELFVLLYVYAAVGWLACWLAGLRFEDGCIWRFLDIYLN